MKISFSTIGCPTWTLKEIIETASECGYDGVELRGVGNQMYLPKSKYFSEENIEKTMGEFRNKNIGISCLTSGAVLTNEDSIVEMSEYIELAEKLGVKYIRVMGEDTPMAKEGTDIDEIIQNLKKIAPVAQVCGVTVLLESNGVFANTKQLRNVLQEVNSDYVCALWDIHHPYRFNNETPKETFENIGEFIKHIHIKDAKVENGVNIYKMIGDGDIPISDVLSILKEENYDGYISLEWVKRWDEELEEAGIVFIQFITAIKNMLK